ncbi:MinD-like ATPase involved in chromosome partitioning or flagellar assembly [Nocardioides salarius]|uniref:MinD-like ATPase involved in chromosome partitioning or flagellar assembly n=1 Tax=Nocardioides salarius TaxID=374513 RepID=A0ABS2M7V6_9ACTN|nr:chromosome partitioning protein [Nocardioides salarius]MBM7507261.1 MinD-like ATPase involved in chromosome partitioning or flagellar assembly [Nocardioides salarius]
MSGPGPAGTSLRGPGEPVVVIVAAAGAAWESTAVGALTGRPGVVLLKRCVDVDDLLAAASAGQADAAVLGLDAHGLDSAAVDLLRRHRVRPVAVVPTTVDPGTARLRASRIGIRTLVPEGRVDTVADAVTAPEVVPEPTRPAYDGAPGAPGAPDAPATPPARPTDAVPAVAAPDEVAPEQGTGRVLAVWGPAGAPGRSTLAVALASELAGRRLPTLLVDADPQAGSIAQQLGVLDEVSGLLAAARLATAGVLEERLASVQRSLGPHLRVVTGLPRADRWSEVRPGSLEHLLELARAQGHVVVDTGASLEDDPSADLGGRPARHALTLGALDVADEVVAVGTADPVGLSRLARGLVELGERWPGTPVRVVVNQMRPTLGWTREEVGSMIGGFAAPASLHFLPEDRAGVDRALVAGRTLLEAGESPLTRAVAELADALVGTAAPAAAAVRRRRAGRARRR